NFKDLYRKRKETIERIFGTAKEFHGLRYTNQIGIEKMHMKIGLTFACLNMKKLVKIKKGRARKECFSLEKQSYFSLIIENIHIKKTNLIFT
ncbi:IS5/IS1182 family transposase, partial [Enterococcus mundtii]